MDSKVKAKLKEFLLNGQIDKALAFIDLIETKDGNYTPKQHRGAWKYMTMRGDALNDAGLDIRKVMKPTFQIPWTKENVYKFLWLPVQEAMFTTKSIRSLKKSQVSRVYNVIERELAEKHGVDQIPFPHDPSKKDEATTLKNIERAKKLDYPTNYQEPTI